jgi:hypothetical protein
MIYTPPIPAGRIAKGTEVFWHHRHGSGVTLLEGTVTRFYWGSGRYGIDTAKGERTPYASVVERWNPAAPRVGGASTENVG